MTRVDATLADTPADRTPSKQYPNSIRVLAQALWQFWPHVSGASLKRRLTLDEFGDQEVFQEAADRLRINYPGAKVPKRSHTALNDVGSSSTFRLRYIHLRLMAEYVDIPTGLLVMFTHYISRERRAQKKGTSKKTALLKLVAQIDAFAAESRKIIVETSESHGENTDFFIELFKFDENGREKEEYLPNLVMLKRLRDAVSSETHRER